MGRVESDFAVESTRVSVEGHEMSTRSALGRAMRKMSGVESAASHECTQKSGEFRRTAKGSPTDSWRDSAVDIA